jgi:hypothetical protein
MRVNPIAQHALLALTRVATRRVVCPALLALSATAQPLHQPFASRAPLQWLVPLRAQIVQWVITPMQGRVFAIPALAACAVHPATSQRPACLEHMPQVMPQAV